MASWRSPVVLFAVLASACSGVVGEGALPATDPPRDPPSPPPTTPKAPQTPPAAAVPPPLAMVRLTRAELVNSVRDVLGAAAASGIEVEADYVSAGSAAVGAREVTVSRAGVRLYADAAEAIASRAVNDPAFRKRWPACAAGEACARTLVTEIGRRLFRRPLSPAERDRWTTVAVQAAAKTGDLWKGLRWALAGLLLSPSFTHRIEIGRIDGDRLRLTDNELAARLSYLLWDSTPDDALLGAADRGELSTPAGLAREVDRLINTQARLAQGLEALGADVFALHALDEVAKDKVRFPDDTPGLRASMRAATLRLVQDVAGRDVDFLSIFDAGVAFVDSRLDRFYGVTVDKESLEPMALPPAGPRVGILTEPSLLALHAGPALTSPTLRGRFIRETILCGKVPDPPPDVDNTLPATARGRTRREQLTDHMTNPACAACHRAMDPLGFAFEGFDAMGAVQTTDNGAPVITSGELDGMAFDGARGLSRLIQQHRDTSACVTRAVIRHVLHGEHLDARTLEPAFQREGRRLLGLVRALVSSDAFQTAARE